MISVAFNALTSGRTQHRRARAARFQELAFGGGSPLEIDLLASHERTVRIGELDAAGELAPARATAVAGRDEWAAPADLRHQADARELGRGEHAVGTLRGQVLEAQIGRGFQYTHGTMSPFGVMRTVWRPHPEPFLNGAPSMALRIGSVVLTSRAAASSRRNPSQNSS